MAGYCLIGLIALWAWQIGNMVFNWTVNERINQSRYSYLRQTSEFLKNENDEVDAGCHSTPSLSSWITSLTERNRFDRGVTFKHIQIHSNTYWYTHTSIQICTHTYKNIHTQTHKYICTHTHIHKNTQIHIYAFTHLFPRVRMCAGVLGNVLLMIGQFKEERHLWGPEGEWCDDDVTTMWWRCDSTCKSHVTYDWRTSGHFCIYLMYFEQRSVK